jgi:hypothetical protein
MTVSLKKTADARALRRALEDLVDWTGALAITGSVTPDAWAQLDKLHERARRALDSGAGV